MWKDLGMIWGAFWEEFERSWQDAEKDFAEFLKDCEGLYVWKHFGMIFDDGLLNDFDRFWQCAGRIYDSEWILEESEIWKDSERILDCGF